MRPALFQTPLESTTVRCDVCLWHCTLADGAAGECRVRRNHGGVIQNEADALVSAATITPVEHLRLWHFFPDAQTFVVGSFGTPLPKRHGGSYANLPPADKRRVIPPDRVVQSALQRLCRGIMWTFNDPIISAEWLLDGLKLARAASRFAALSSSGYWTPAVVEAIGPYLDGLRLDLLGFSDRAYATLGGITGWQAILDVAERLRQNWNIHIEVTLKLQAGVNDDAAQVRRLATWIKSSLGLLTPLHLLLPPSTPPEAASQAISVARAAGLPFVYGPLPEQITRCPSCATVAIRRTHDSTDVANKDSESCSQCSAPLGIRTSIFKRRTMYHREP
ncbi:MAG: radical SAM protein [Herpetosiphon sp.]